jgi:hypothetical protein
LPNAERRKSALSLVKKAAAAMTSVICRCHPCHGSHSVRDRDHTWHAVEGRADGSHPFKARNIDVKSSAYFVRS